MIPDRFFKSCVSGVKVFIFVCNQWCYSWAPRYPDAFRIHKKCSKCNFVIYDDDRLSALKHIYPIRTIKEKRGKMFKEDGLDNIMQCNVKIVILLDAIFNITDWTYKHKTKQRNLIHTQTFKPHNNPTIHWIKIIYPILRWKNIYRILAVWSKSITKLWL